MGVLYHLGKGLMKMDLKQIEAEAKAELVESQAKELKGKIKKSLETIAAAELVLANAKREHESLMLRLKDLSA